MAIRPLVGTPLAGCCTVLSFLGIVILLALGVAFDHGAEVLTGSTKSPKDAHAVAQQCYRAAIVYAAFVGFCGCQIGMNARHARGVVRI
ncbi:BQ2448_3778 [Microbotryum intermedium]|uniref:BQ2448_3778 protein n=1 Tax=Microbotryum intermedium TaxID=269621 RepID=A0A238FIW7_9BASI|nr:BQ2448_3778 [Microbotryum intermedium]